MLHDGLTGVQQHIPLDNLRRGPIERLGEVSRKGLDGLLAHLGGRQAGPAPEQEQNYRGRIVLQAANVTCRRTRQMMPARYVISSSSASWPGSTRA